LSGLAHLRPVARQRRATACTSAARLAKYLPGKKTTSTPVKIGLIDSESSSPVAEPSTGDAAVPRVPASSGS